MTFLSMIVLMFVFSLFGEEDPQGPLSLTLRREREL